jgi:hypothetical protein
MDREPATESEQRRRPNSVAGKRHRVAERRKRAIAVLILYYPERALLVWFLYTSANDRNMVLWFALKSLLRLSNPFV